MRLLYLMDAHNYPDDEPVRVRPSVRGIIIREEKIALVHSLLYDYYKFPGGGLEQNETVEEALIREVREETGLQVELESIRPFGRVRRLDAFDSMKFVQDSDYYLCDADPEPVSQSLDEYENRERFTLEWVTWRDAVHVNRSRSHGPKSPVMIERENRVLELLHAEGLL